MGEAFDDAEPRLSAVSSRFESLAEVLATPVLTADAEGLVDYANPAARELFWLSDEQLHGKGWLGAVHDDERDAVAREAHHVDATGTAAIAEFRLDVAGQPRWARFNAVPAADGSGHGWVAIFDDITSDRATAEDLARLATHDTLTGLANRALLLDHFDLAQARCLRHQLPLAVSFIDLDRFKSINDRYGHHVGDEVLRTMSARIVASVRTEDTAARLGGDEFVVLAEGVSREASEVLAQRLVDAAAAPMSLDGKVLELGASVGIAWTERPEETPDQLLERADKGMYLAKHRRRACAFGDPEPAPET